MPREDAQVCFQVILPHSSFNDTYPDFQTVSERFKLPAEEVAELCSSADTSSIISSLYHACLRRGPTRPLNINKIFNFASE
jgi:hypothetical protein